MISVEINYNKKGNMKQNVLCMCLNFGQELSKPKSI